jgi:hypothetical protein
MRPELLFRIPLAELCVRWHRSRASDDTWQGGSKPKKKPNDQARSYAGFQMFKHMLRVDTRGDKLRAFLGHGSQKPQSTVVNEGDFTEVNRASSPVLCTVPFFPACPQFADPGLDQTTFKGPPLFCGRFGNGNSQHSRGSFSSPSGVRPWFTGRFDRPISSAMLYQRGEWFANARASTQESNWSVQVSHLAHHKPLMLKRNASPGPKREGSKSSRN